MFTTFRRFLVLGCWAFWLGGFIFYIAIVVPRSMEVLEQHPNLPHRTQGFVTRRVAPWLNGAGMVSLSLFALDWACSRRRAGRLAWIQAACWFGMAATLIWLWILFEHL